jgi:hypothetical protein
MLGFTAVTLLFLGFILHPSSFILSLQCVTSVKTVRRRTHWGEKSLTEARTFGITYQASRSALYIELGRATAGMLHAFTLALGVRLLIAAASDLVRRPLFLSIAKTPKVG